MAQLYPIQIIALDETAHKACEIASLSRFDKISFTDSKSLSLTTLKGYRQIIVLSEINENILENIKSELLLLEDPIIIMPDNLDKVYELNILLLMGVRVIFYPIENLTSISLSNELNRVEKCFYADESKDDVVLDHKEIYELIPKSSAIKFYENSNQNIARATMSALNDLDGFGNIISMLVLFETYEDTAITEIADALNFVEKILPRDSSILFTTRTIKANETPKVICMANCYLDFKQFVQKEVDTRSTYLLKLSTIAEAYHKEFLNTQEAMSLAEENGLSSEDLSNLYTLLYTDPVAVTNLIKTAKDESTSKSKREDLLAHIWKDTMINDSILEEIAKAYNLSVENIFKTVIVQENANLSHQNNYSELSVEKTQ